MPSDQRKRTNLQDATQNNKLARVSKGSAGDAPTSSARRDGKRSLGGREQYNGVLADKQSDGGKNDAFAILDQLSISQKFNPTGLNGRVSDGLYFEVKEVYEKSRETDYLKCEHRAPHIFFVDDSGTAKLVQGCCNSWYCPRCSNIRAREEYGRIVSHAKTLAEDGVTLFFTTLTMRGADLDRERMDDDYLLYTNRLLSACRARCKTQKDEWVYVQVTERQKRGAAHSHIIGTFAPSDVILCGKGALLPTGAYTKHETLYSQWLVERSTSAGLGRMCDISLIENNIAVAVYVAKYLFKSLKQTVFPKHWRRVRYSQSWPKLDRNPPEIAFPLIRLADWYKMERWAKENNQAVYAGDEVSYEAALARLITNVRLSGRAKNAAKVH